MCKKGFFNIKSVSTIGSRHAFVPCGVCPSCRNMKRESWVFRLRVEFEELVKRGFSVGFVTLTYNEKNIPRIPYKFVKSDFRNLYSPYKMPMCFSRSDINGLIKYLRNWMYRERKISKELKLRFMICSEFGEETARPHYHGIFCIPPSINPREFYNKLTEFWTKKGFVIPKDFEGGYDTKNRYHKPFLVDCVSDACKYTAKYVCKDIAFYESINKEHFKNYKGDDEDKLSDYLPFHSQSKSLGISFLDKLTDEQKFDYFYNGVSFIGDDKLRHMPIYFKNKLLFTNYYVTDSQGQRLCRRLASDFFKRYYRAIFQKKVDYAVQRLDFWLRENKSFEFCGQTVTTYDMFTKIGVTRENLCAQYIAYFGVPQEFCLVMPLDKFWFERYRYVTDGVIVHDDVIETREPWTFTVDSGFKNMMETFFVLLQLSDNVHQKQVDVLQFDDECLVNKMRDFYYF